MQDLKEKNFTRFLLTFFLGWIGSIIINVSEFKPKGYRSRTLAYFFLSICTFGIYGLVAAISNLNFDPAKESNIGYMKDEDYVPPFSNNQSVNSSVSSGSSSTDTHTTEKIQLSLSEKLKKIVILFSSIFALIMLFIPFEGSGGNVFAFITFQIRDTRYDEVPFFIYFFGYIHLIASIALTVLACRDLNKQKLNDKIFLFGSIGCGVLHTLINIIYRASNDYDLVFYYPRALIIAICFFVIYIVIDKFVSDQTSNQQSVSAPAKSASTSEIDDKAIGLLKKFADLKETGVITQEEFDAKKKEILGL